MNILVIGASGRVGSKLTEGLLKDGHSVTGATRKEKKLFDAPNYNQVKLDITQSLNEIEHAIPESIEAIYFVSGSRGKNLLQVDLHGAVKTMQAAEKKRIKRYILLSALNSLQPENWSSIIDYYTAKHFADLYLMHQTQLDYTILQPGHLNEEKGNGMISIPEDGTGAKGDVSIQSVADTLISILDKPNTYKKAIPMLDGDVPISEAVSRV